MNPSGIEANESVAHRSSGPPLKYLQRYGLAVLSVGVALGASLLLEHFHFRVPSALLLLFAVAISSWYAGAGPAVLAAILSTISFYWYFVEPVRTISINRSEIPYFVIFTAFAALLSRFGTFRQRAEADLRQTHDQLRVEQPKLGSRTIALLYFAFSSCWILFTDRLVHGLGLSNAYLLKVSEAKGILFISLSTLLMYVLVEKALRERHSVATAYWQLVETAQEGVWSVDAEGKTVFANENMAAILGTSPGEMIGKSILPFVPQEKKDELLSHLLQGEQGLQEHYEFPFLRADGAQVWTLLRVSPVLRDGQHSGCLALVSDITKRKHAEEALRRLNRELRAISNCNQALLRATDEQSLLEEICRIVCEEAGYRMAWVSYAEHDEAKSVRPVAWTGAEEGYLASAGITWADTDRGRSPTGTAIRSGKSCCIQDFATDPRLAPWRERLLQRGFRSVIALPLKDENDNAFGSLTIHSAQPNAFTSEEVRLLEELAGDLAFGIVTLRSEAARKRAEQEVTLLSFALDRVREAALLVDDTGRFRYVNEDGCRVLGYTREELLGMGVPDIDLEFPAGRWSDHWRDLKSHRSLNFESRHRTRDGRIFPVEISANYFEYAGQAYNLALARDITERKRAEEQREKLRQLEADLAHIDRVSVLGELAASISHDLQQPIAAAIMNAATCLQWLQRDQPDLDKVRRAAQRVVDAGQLATEIIDSLRSLYKKAAPRREPIDVNEVVREMLVLLRGEAIRYAVSIRTDLNTDFLEITADRVQVQQVLMNLMLNAIEAMKDSGGVLKVKSELEDSRVLISVSDTGVGLPADKADRIFDAFFTTKPQGSGMGLAISRSIVESHGGRLWATSNEGRGATFRFTLPTTTAVALAPAGVL